MKFFDSLKAAKPKWFRSFSHFFGGAGDQAAGGRASRWVLAWVR